MPQITPYRKTIGIISTYPPRLCGLATFAADLCTALNEELSPFENLIVIAMDDGRKDYAYSEHIHFKIRDKELSDYYSAADFLNTYCDIVILQHEYNIFGGKYGSYIVELLKNLQIPIITTFHTIRLRPKKEAKQILVEIGKLSDKLIVMTNKGKEFLLEVYGVCEEKISIIPHGFHDVPFIEENSLYKEQLKLDNRKIILSFGLLSKWKGFEYVIDAMPRIIKEYKDTLYIILGKTHPNRIHKLFGEQYRNELQKKIKKLKLENHVRFYNQYVKLELLLKFLIAADVYIIPYIIKDQICSGTLSYALGTGNAVISTPFYHAEEFLADGRGILIPFKDSNAIAQAIIDLFSSDSVRNEMRKKAYRFTRSMTWKKVGCSYLNIIQQHLEHQRRNIKVMP